jgi:transcriptional regulator GlxA family with amidase domain
MNRIGMHSRLEQVKDWQAIAKEAGYKVNSMAALCSVEPRTLERFFYRKFHQAPKQWAKARRLEMAKALIRQGWLHKEVAKELGFSNEGHLSQELRS